MLCFTINGPNISTTQYVKGGYSSNLSFGRSVAICPQILPQSLQHIVHLKTTDFTAELPHNIQKLLHLISLSVITLLLCAVFELHHFPIKSAILLFSDRSIGYTLSWFKPDLLILPPTLIIPDSPRKRSNEHSGLPLLKFFSLLFILSISSLTYFCWNRYMISSLAFCSISISSNPLMHVFAFLLAILCFALNCCIRFCFNSRIQFYPDSYSCFPCCYYISSNCDQICCHDGSDFRISLIYF